MLLKFAKKMEEGIRDEVYAFSLGHNIEQIRICVSLYKIQFVVVYLINKQPVW